MKVERHDQENCLNLPLTDTHCVKSVRIRSYSGPHFPAFGLNTERYSVSLRIQSECGKIRTRITPNRDTFYAVTVPTTEQPSRGVLSKTCCENMQQIYRRTPMPKCDFNKVALQFY